MYQPHATPIHVLSDDILVLIFLHFPANPTSIQLADEFTWMYITHVCHRWRSISLSCSSLWTRICFKPPSWTPVFLERARQAPLQIEVDWRRDGARHYIDDAVALALDHLHHTRYLALINPPSRFTEQGLLTLKRQAADILEVLRLYMFTEATPSLGVPMTTLDLPDTLFAGHAPRLQELVVKGQFALSWHNQLFSSRITRLHLSRLLRPLSQSMDDLLELLRTCPLEELLLDDCLPSRSTPLALAPLPENYPLVDIPTLRVLGTSDIAIRVADLFRRLRIPANCQIFFNNRHLWHSNNASSATTSEALATEVDLVFATRSTLRKCALSIAQRHFNECTWHFHELGPPAPSAPLRDEMVEPRVEFALALRSDPGPTTLDEVVRDAAAYAGAFSRITPLYRLNFLHMLSISAISAALISLDVWLVTLPELHRLVVLQVKGQCCYSFATALALLSDNRQTLPFLRKLEIFHAHLAYPLGPHGLAIELESALVRRKSINASAPYVEFKHCHISPSQLRKLEEASGQAIDVTGDPDTWGVGEDDENEEIGEDLSAEESEEDD
ncbi:hypothetical protein PENSPDRAFT_752549 [Peniophora sp. CONT]|nr:hypothetical protein PENSPDRAFT_752549 [Peniophora sp. CONT]